MWISHVLFLCASVLDPFQAQPLTYVRVGLDWKAFSGWNDFKGLLSGSLGVDYEWNQTLQIEWEDEAVDVRDVVMLDNFMTGNGGRVKLQKFDYIGPEGTLWRRASMLYIGNLHQKIDGTCYPWDTVTAYMNFSITGFHQVAMGFNLYCPYTSTSCSAYDASGQHLENTDGQYHQIVPKFVLDGMDKVKASGFEWSKLTCELVNVPNPFVGSTPARIVCSMKGVRLWGKPFMKNCFPALILLFIGFSSEIIPLKMSMPRIATTMIALMCFVSKSIAAFDSFPPSGVSVVMEFYILGTITLFLSLLSHALSFRFENHALGIRSTLLSFGICVTILVPVVRLHNRGCTEQLSQAGTGVVVFLVATFIAVYIGASLWLKHRRTRQAACARAKDQEGEVSVQAKENQGPEGKTQAESTRVPI